MGGGLSTKELLAHCSGIIAEAIARPSSWSFCEEAARKEGRPASLETIKGRLDEGHYRSVLHFVSDLRGILVPHVVAAGLEGDKSKREAGTTRRDWSKASGGQYPESGEYVAEDDETPRSIAKKIGVSHDQLVTLNKPTFPALHVNSRLLPGTLLQLPPPVSEGGSPAYVPPEESKVNVTVEKLRGNAALGLLRSIEVCVCSYAYVCTCAFLFVF